MHSVYEKAHWLLGILDEGKKSLEAIIAENSRLRESLAKTQLRIREIGPGPESTGRIRELEAEVERLTLERDRAAQGRTGPSEVEEQYDTVTNLFVAVLALNGAWRASEVLTILRELFLNSIGATGFELYLLDRDGARLLSVGLTSFAGRPPPAAAEPRIAEALGSAGGARVWADAPRAIVPVLVGRSPVGVLMVNDLLPQKTEFNRADQELFHLLSEQLGPVLRRTLALERAGVAPGGAAGDSLIDLVRP